jgi:hypothetical protein
MNTRRSHYEMAFEAQLNRRGTPYVAVEDVRSYIKGRLGAKAFDYVVYPLGSPPCLVDVKGRKIKASPVDADARTKNWVTRADLDGLTEWQAAFGPEYRAVFVFSFWLAAEPEVPPPEPPAADVLLFAGRSYSFWVAPVADYLQFQKPLSKRWGTVNVPTAEFRRISSPLELAWPAAAC